MGSKVILSVWMVFAAATASASEIGNFATGVFYPDGPTKIKRTYAHVVLPTFSGDLSLVVPADADAAVAGSGEIFCFADAFKKRGAAKSINTKGVVVLFPDGPAFDGIYEEGVGVGVKVKNNSAVFTAADVDELYDLNPDLDPEHVKYALYFFPRGSKKVEEVVLFCVDNLTRPLLDAARAGRERARNPRRREWVPGPSTR